MSCRCIFAAISEAVRQARSAAKPASVRYFSAPASDPARSRSLRRRLLFPAAVQQRSSAFL